MDPTDYQHNEDMCDVAEFLLDRDELEGATEGIARQILGKGWTTLTSKQKEVFEKHALPLAKKDCQLCDGEIPLNELRGGGDYCSYCASKFNEENKTFKR